MAKSSKSQKRANNELRKIQSAGITSFSLGVLFLITPAFLKSSKLLASLGAQIGSLAIWFLGIGVALIFVYALLAPKEEDKSKQVDTDKPFATKKSTTLVSETVSQNTTPYNRQWSKQVFSDIEWRRFEALCEKYFAQVGFKTESKSHGADGGVDVWIYSENAVGPVSIAQCKHYRGRNEVTVEQMQAFYGVMSFNNLARGTFITSSTYTAPAQAFANKTGIHMLDGDKFLKQILSRTTEQQQELLQVAYEGDYATPTCVNCGIKLIKKDKTYFRGKNWRCKNYVYCKTEMY